MAARRIGKSGIDWVKFMETTPVNQKANFQAFKAKSDGYLSKVLSVPENPPPINWSYYRKKIPLAGLVDQFEKEYTALKIPYPTSNLVAEVDTQEKEAEKEVVQFVKESEKRIADYKLELDKWHTMIPFEHMTMEDFRDNFPDEAMDTFNRPTLWPHIPEEQPGYRGGDDDTPVKSGH